MKVLIPVEDKFFGEAIIDFVAHHQWSNNIEFKIIHVLEPMYTMAMGAYPTDFLSNISEERLRAGKALVLSIGTKLQQALPSAKVSEEVLEGSPKEIILDVINQWTADLLVVGSHGRTGLGQFFLGSVSISLLATVPCSMLVVRPPKIDEKKKEKAQSQAKEMAEEDLTQSW